LVRIFIEQDPDDPIVFVVTTEPSDNAIPVIPTSKAHDLWLYASSSDDAAQHRPRKNPRSPSEPR